MFGDSDADTGDLKLHQLGHCNLLYSSLNPLAKQQTSICVIYVYIHIHIFFGFHVTNENVCMMSRV